MSNHNSQTHEPYSVHFIADGCEVRLAEYSRDDERYSRVFDLYVDKRHVGQFEMLSFYIPAVSIGEAHVVISGHTYAHVVDRKTYELKRFEQQWEMRAAYPIGRRWCFVTELSVALVDLDLLSVVDEVNDFNEVILKWRWDRNELIIEDFEGRPYIFSVSQKDFSLKPIRAD